MLKLKNLYCEYMKNPINIDTISPRLSWTIESTKRAIMQKQYRIILSSIYDMTKHGHGDMWDSEWVVSSESANITYNGLLLKSNTKYWWSVQIRDEKGNESSFALPEYFETALIYQSDWKSKWIGAKSPKTLITGYEYSEIKSPFFRKEVSLSKRVKKAKAFFSGLGWGELYINGQKVGNNVLDPAPTDYDKTILYSTYDVTHYFKNGDNALGIIVGNGWFCEYMWKESYGASAKAMLQISLQYEDGSTDLIITDKSWKTSFGPILETRIWGGEVYDARLELDNWNNTGYNDSKWIDVSIKDRSRGIMKSQLMPPIKVNENIKAHLLSNNKKGVLLYDMKEFFGGWTQIKFKGKAGSVVKIRYSDRITESRKIDQRLQVSVPNVANRKDMWQPSTDVYILKGSIDGEIYEPRFTYHPVHYVQIEFSKGDVIVEQITGRKVYSSIDLSAKFKCDNELLNKIHKAVVQTFTNQMFGIPLDCLYREHWGWIDPGSLAGTLYTRQYMPSFWKKWLDDIQQSQFANGAVPDIAPNYNQWDNVDPIWGGSYPRLVWFLYQYYNDKQLLANHYDNMKKSYGFHNLHAVDGILTEGSYGDHMLPGDSAGQEQFISDETSPEFLWTGCHYETAIILSKSAEILGYTIDSEHYKKCADTTKNVINNKWFDAANNCYDTGSQTSQFYALATGIVPNDYETKVLERTINDIKHKYNGSHHTGNTGTTAMIDVLCDMGRQDIMYDIINKTTYPGWGYMIVNDSTTIWESWSQISNSGCSELSMTLWATIDEFFYNDIIGIKGPNFFKQSDGFTPGFKNIVIAPYLPYNMSNASGSINTIYGRISSSWEKQKDYIIIKVSIPANTTATIKLPTNSKSIIMESDTVIWTNGNMANAPYGIDSCIFSEENVSVNIGSGEYCFKIIN